MTEIEKKTAQKAALMIELRRTLAKYELAEAVGVKADDIQFWGYQKRSYKADRLVEKQIAAYAEQGVAVEQVNVLHLKDGSECLFPDGVFFIPVPVPAAEVKPPLICELIGDSRFRRSNPAHASLDPELS
jgi:hypothetical protein